MDVIPWFSPNSGKMLYSKSSSISPALYSATSRITSLKAVEIMMVYKVNHLMSFFRIDKHRSQTFSPK